MKQLLNQSLFILFAILVGTGCKKSELTQYEQPDMVYIYKDYINNNRDSISYSFAIMPTSLVADTVKVPLRIMGAVKKTDRQVNVKVITDSTTAIAGQHFDLLPAVIKAGEYTGYIPVLVKRTADIKTIGKRLLIEVIASPDFQPGVPNTAAVSPRAGGGLRFLVKMNDFLSKPSNWDNSIVFSFGSYSQVKYRFVIDVTGRTEFVLGPGVNDVSSSQMTYFKILCKQALAVYNASNPPLTDEFGQLVTFPN